MTNREKLNSLNDEELAIWLCRQMWDDYDKGDTETDFLRFHSIRKWLNMEYKEETPNEHPTKRNSLHP